MADDTEKSSSNEPAKETVKSLRTFESDVAEALQGEHTTAAQIVIAETARAEISHEKTVVSPGRPPNPERTKTFLWAGGIIAGAAVIIVAAYFIFKPAPAPSTPTTSGGTPLITVDAQKQIDLTNVTHEQTISAIASERDSAGLRVNAAENLIFTQKDINGQPQPLTTADFFAKFSPSIPSNLIRQLDPNFALGLLGFNGNQPFLILHTNSYQNTFGLLLQSEVDLYREAGPAFVRGGGALPSLSTTTGAYFGTDPSHQIFRDAVVNNTDARVVRDGGGNIVFMYAFANPTTLIITTNGETYAELVNRLRRANLL